MRGFSSVLRHGLARQERQNADHLDADTLVAFAERNLSRSENAAVMRHLADCAECREVLLLSAQMGQAHASASQNVPACGRMQWRWQAAAAAAVVFSLIVGGWISFRLRHSPETATVLNTKLAVLSRPAAPKAQSAPLPERAASAPRHFVEKRATAARKSPPGNAGTASENRIAPAEPTVEAVPLSAAAPANEPENATESASIELREAEAQIISPKAMQAETTGPPLAIRNDFAAPEMALSAAHSANRARALTVMPFVHRSVAWSLGSSSSDGTLQKSEDGGTTWRTVMVHSGTRLYSLSAGGRDVWVGGADGKLFRSVDNGDHWMAIPVTDGAIQLTEDIVKIETRSAMVTVRTSSGATWTTVDGGRDWRRQ